MIKDYKKRQYHTTVKIKFNIYNDLGVFPTVGEI